MRVDLSRMTAAAIEAALDDGKPVRRPHLSGMRAVAAGAALAVAARAAVKHAPGLRRMPDLSSVPDLVRERLADRGLLPDEEDAYDDEQYEDVDDPSAEGDQDEDEDEDEDVDGPDAEGDDDVDGPDAESEDDEDDGPDAEGEDDDDDDLDDEDDPDAEDDDGPEAEGDDDESDEEDLDDEPDARADEDEGEGADEEREADEARNSRRTTANARARAPRLEVPDNGRDPGTEVPGVLELLSAHRSRPPVMSRRRRGSRIDPAARPPEPPERESETRAGSRK
ncbi:MAG: hypothetical protein V7607_2281 [Solirubrobacteraceae bacterium]